MIQKVGMSRKKNRGCQLIGLVQMCHVKGMPVAGMSIVRRAPVDCYRHLLIVTQVLDKRKVLARIKPISDVRIYLRKILVACCIFCIVKNK